MSESQKFPPHSWGFCLCLLYNSNAQSTMTVICILISLRTADQLLIILSAIAGCFVRRLQLAGGDARLRCGVHKQAVRTRPLPAHLKTNRRHTPGLSSRRESEPSQSHRLGHSHLCVRVFVSGAKQVFLKFLFFLPPAST